MAMTSREEATQWEWSITDSQKSHHERVALLRPILYERTTSLDSPTSLAHGGKALSLNMSSGGMLVLMEQMPDLNQVLKVYMPTPLTVAETPTLAEVRWIRPVPLGQETGNGPYFVGLKFMF
jgi:PilZ domain